MTKEEFMALPAALALGLLWDAGLDKRLATVEAPRAPRPPKYDMAIYRKGGIQWASEMDLSGLEWWQARYREGAASGGEYAEKDAKRAEKMQYWIDWRRADPQAIWSGTRNDTAVTARAPLARPEVSPRDEPSAATTNTAPAQDFGPTDYSDPGGDDDQLPF
jgi:hypothetical protein